MEFSQVKQATIINVVNYVDIMRENGIKVKVYECENNSENRVLSFNGKLIEFNSNKDLINYLRPLIAIIEEEEERAKFRNRVMRELMIEAVENVAKRYDKQIYNFSLGEIQK